MSETPTPPRRRWFQFGLRTMFVVVTVLAGLVAYHVNWMHQRHESLAKGRGPGGIGFLEFRESEGIPWVDRQRSHDVLKLLGEDAYQEVLIAFVVPADEAIDRRFNDAERAEIRAVERSFPEARVIGHLVHDPN